MDTNANSSAGTFYGNVIASAQRLQNTISQFAQEYGGNQERFAAMMKNLGAQPNQGAGNVQEAPADAISPKASALAQQLQGAISRFAEKMGESHEGGNALLKRIGDRLQETNTSLQKNQERIDLVARQIRNSRS